MLINNTVIFGNIENTYGTRKRVTVPIEDGERKTYLKRAIDALKQAIEIIKNF